MLMDIFLRRWMILHGYLTLEVRDVESNPVFLSYAIVQQSDAILFVESKKISEEIQSKLANETY
jgi:hypothetical protein